MLPIKVTSFDGYLNDIRSRPFPPKDLFTAIRSAKEGVISEGAVGAGTNLFLFAENF